MADTLFWIFSAVALASAIGVLANVRSTVNAAVSLVVSMLAVAGLYFLLFAQFVALIQVMVYAGAMGAESQPLLKLAGAGVIVLATWKLAGILSTLQRPWPVVGADYGTTRTVGLALYSDYVLAFEIAGVLLFAGIIAAVIIGKRSLD